MELPRTRTQLVVDGFGHQSFGAAIMLSIGASCSNSLFSPAPFSPCATATDFSNGIATSCNLAFDFGLFAPPPAATTSRCGNCALRKRSCNCGTTRNRSSLLKPARPQKYQHQGSPERLPISM